MKHYNLYKVVREVRKPSGTSISESQPMRYADGMSALARSLYYDHEFAILHLKKFVYWFHNGEELTKVHLVRA